MKIPAITDLLNRQDSEEVMEISILLCDIERSLDCKALIQQEYADLMVDVERLRVIIALKKNLELNQMIHDAVVGIIELAKLVKP
jgi:hypothetical protein